MKYLIGLLVTIVVIIFIIIKLLTGGGGSVTEQPKPLGDYADTETTMRYTEQTQTQAPETYREVQISVGRDSSEISIFKGYDGQVIKRQVYANTEASYRNFLRSLQISGDYNDGNTDRAFYDASGYCANGDRFIYEVVNGSNEVTQHFWSTSCGDKTFQGNIDVAQQLFHEQIPNYDDLTQDIEF